MKRCILIVALISSPVSADDLIKCKQQNKQKLLDFYNGQTQKSNYCTTSDECFYLDRHVGFHVNVKDVVQLSTCLSYAYTKAKAQCFAGQSGVSHLYEFFELGEMPNPSGYECIQSKCIPLYNKPARRWAKETSEKVIKAKKSGRGSPDEQCVLTVDRLFTK